MQSEVKEAETNKRGRVTAAVQLDTVLLCCVYVVPLPAHLNITHSDTCTCCVASPYFRLCSTLLRRGVWPGCRLWHQRREARRAESLLSTAAVSQHGPVGVSRACNRRAAIT